jgi:DNA polymerase delta subunit 2
MQSRHLADKKLKFGFSYIAVTTVLGLEEGKECIIVGTLYKHMKLKPSILDEYSKEVM